MANKQRPRWWKTLGVEGHRDPVARLLPRLAIVSMGAKPPKIAAIRDRWLSLAKGAAKEGRCPILLYRDGWSGFRLAIIPREVWGLVYGKHPPPPGPGWADAVSCYHDPDLRLLVRLLAELPPGWQV